MILFGARVYELVELERVLRDLRLERRLRDLSLVSGSVGPRRLRVIWFWLMVIFVLRACVGWLASHCWLSPLCLLSCGPMVAVLGVGRSLLPSPLCFC